MNASSEINAWRDCPRCEGTGYITQPDGRHRVGDTSCDYCEGRGCVDDDVVLGGWSHVPEGGDE
jgi:DnaJ-class molecular chaperone